MVKKSLGYVELEWVCPQCDSRNKGTSKKCASCGAAQPEDVEFHQAAQETLITDEAKIARAKAGPDIHCPYCGTRNLATAEKCVQCGGDLTGGTVRESGQVVGAHRTEPVEQATCPHCGASNPATALKCSKCGGAMKPVTTRRPAARSRRAATGRDTARPKRKINPLAIVGIAVVALILITFCVVIVLSMLPSKEITGTVQSVSWERSIVVQGLQDVTREAWQDEIPAGAPIGTCTEKVHHTQPDPAPRSVEVCGTPYTVDTGTGMGEVVQDCEYQVYDDWCTYTAKEWVVIDTLVLNGSDFDPAWPVVGVATARREGSREETYKVVFATEDKTYTRAFTDVNRWRQYPIGSRWILQLNKLGGIQSIEPVE